MVHHLAIDSVIKRYNERLVLSDIYLSLSTSQIIGIFGRNGSGKSTLFKILCGIETAENCFIKLNGKRIEKPFKQKDIISYSPQDIFFPRNVSTKDILDVFYNRKLPTNVFERFYSLFKTEIGNLSGGEQKLLQLYAVLNSESKFVILDEPFAHLSPIMINEIKSLIVEESKTKGIILSDHSFRDVLDISSELYLLQNGKLKKINHETELIENGYLL